MHDGIKIISSIKDILVALAAVCGIWIGFSGLNEWRRELRGKSEFAKAKEVLRAVYVVRAAFWHARNPAIWSNEYPAEMFEPSGTLKSECRRSGRAHVYQQRMKVLALAFDKLEEQNLDAQVEWPGFEDVIWPLRKCWAELDVAVQTCLEDLNTPNVSEGKSSQEMTKSNSIVRRSNDDEFTIRINEAIQEFEKKLRPKIAQ